MFTCVHSLRCSSTRASPASFASEFLNCANLVRRNRSTRVASHVSFSSKIKLVPFRGVVAPAASGGVCPMSAHLPDDQHFDAVSRGRRIRLLLATCFTRLLRRMQHALEMRSIRAVLTLIICASVIAATFVRAWGADVCSDVHWLYARALRCFIRCETTTAATL